MSSTFLGDSELAALMRAKDWSTTPLGPEAGWPMALRSAVRVVLTSRFAMWMGWGDDLTFFYNDAYARDTLAAKHPWALGQPAREVWREIWTEIGPRIANVLSTGTATWDEGLMLFLERSGYPEETYHTFSYSPLHDDAGAVRGMLCVVVEETSRVLSERRVALLGRLGTELASTNSSAAVFHAIERTLAHDARDLPFTLTYLDGELAASTGFGPVAAPAAFPIGEGGLVELPPGAWPRGPWERAPTHAMVVTLPGGAFVAGLNPHRAVDAPIRELATLFAGQIAAGLANARLYAEERRRAEALAELDRAKTAFFSNVSHELRTPLTLMLGPLQSLIDTAVDRVELLTIQRNGERLLKLVNTMLDFSRVEAGRAKADLVPVDLGHVSSDLAGTFRAAIERAGLTLVVEVDGDTSALVDLDMWEKVVLNLLSNALKFTLAGEIRVRIARTGQHVRLVVSDTGTGIPAGELPHVFERFHRVAGAVGRTHEGTGIGLALVQELVKLCGGTVSVVSELGKGTAFTVELPASSEAPRTTIQPRHASAYTGEALRWLPGDESAITAPDDAARIVVADDNADMRDYMRRLLGARWQVETVANGKQAMLAIARQRPALVITDVMMPELDGFGVLAQVRGAAALRELPVIMLSARAGEEARIEGLQAGATDYVVKPFAARELVARVEAVLAAAQVRAVELAQRRQLEQLFAHAPVGVALTEGSTHRFTLANPEYRAFLGGRDVVGKTIAEVMPELEAQGVIALLDRVYGGEPFYATEFHIRLARVAGGPLEDAYFDFTYQPMRDASGTVTGVAVIAHDVTTSAKGRRDAESANQTKDEFLAMLGHELRNPLAPILTALELVRMRGNPGREHAVIERQVKHLVALVDDLLDVSRITRGKVELEKKRVDLAEAIAQAIEIASPLLEQHHHQLTVDVPALIVDGDRGRLAQIFSNLLTNAAKYTPAGGRIAITGRREGDRAVIGVRDNGIGIEPAMLSRVFEPFAQARQAIDRRQGGLGLGLAIVSNLTALHGGTVTAHSAGRGQGTELIVSLPLGTAATTAPVVEAKGSARVLVVDDNVDAAQLLADLLEVGGYETLAAHDGPSALKAAETFRPQVAVLDIGLPVMDGFELAGRFRADPALAGTRLVAVTGYGQAEDRKRTEEAGFSAHLVKPVDIRKLRATLEKLLGSP